MQNTEKCEAFGLSEDEAKNVQDILPTLELGKMSVGDSVRVKCLSESPKDIEWEDKETKKKNKTPAIEVLNKDNGLKMSLWLSSKSLKQEFFKVFKQNKENLKGLDIVIAIEEYDHDKYGKTRAYRVQIDKREN